MKKIIASVFMVCLLLGTAVFGSYVTGSVDGKPEPGAMEMPKQTVPAPPDPLRLENLGLEPFVSDLPVLMIDSRGGDLTKEIPVWTQVAILDDPGGSNNILGGADQVLTATLKYRGASSYSRFDKPQFRMEFHRREEGKSLEYGLFGMAPDSRWVLHGPFLDRSLLRNYLMYGLARETMDWAPDARFCEVFLDGDYLGVYLAVEPVSIAPDRIPLRESGLLSGATPYMIKRDRVGTETNVLHTWGELNFRTGQELSVAYPNRISRQQKLWIEQDVSAFEEALYADYFADPDIGYAAYIDVDSFVDYFLLNEFAMNHDAGILSTYAYKDMGGKLKLCVWDFNNGFDNYQWFTMDPNEFHITENYWFDRLLQDRAFVDKLNTRYAELRGTVLSGEHIFQRLEQGLELLGEAPSRNFAKWGYTFQQSLMGGTDPDGSFRDPKDFPDAVRLLKDIITRRLDFMDSSMETLYANCVN